MSPTAQDIGILPDRCKSLGNGSYLVVVGSYSADALNASARERASAYAEAKLCKAAVAQHRILLAQSRRRCLVNTIRFLQF